MFSLNSSYTERLLPDAQDTGEKELIAEELKTLSQTKKTLATEIQSLEKTIQKLEVLLNTLRDDFKKIDRFDFKKAKESQIRNHYREVIKAHPIYAQTLQELADLLVDLYMNRFINPTLSFGKKLTSFSHFSNRQASVSTLTKTGYQFEIWTTVEMPQEDFLKLSYKQKLEMIISAVDSQLNKLRLGIIGKQNAERGLDRQIDHLKPEPKRSKFR